MFGVERNRAKILSIQSLRKLLEEAPAGSKRFMLAFGNLMVWIRVRLVIIQQAALLSNEVAYQL